MFDRQFVGTSNRGDLNEAIADAIRIAKQSLQSTLVVWRLEATAGENGGFVQKNELFATISAGVPEGADQQLLRDDGRPWFSSEATIIPNKLNQEQHEIDAARARVLDVPAGILESKSWSNFDKDPWVFKSDDTSLGKIADISVALTRTKKSSPPYFTLRSIIAYYKTSLGWCTTGNGKRLDLKFLDDAGNVLYSHVVWPVIPGPMEVTIRKNDNNTFFSHRHKWTDDLYDDVDSVSLSVMGHTWQKCT